MSVIQSLYKSFGSGVVAPDTGVVLQNRGAYFNTDPAHPELLRARQAAVPHPDRLRGHARRRAGAGLLEHGRRRAGDVPRPVAHQRARLRPGDPGGHRAAALRGRAHRSGRRRRTRCASRAGCPRRPARRSAAGATTSRPSPTSSCAWATPTASRSPTARCAAAPIPAATAPRSASDGRRARARAPRRARGRRAARGAGGPRGRGVGRHRARRHHDRAGARALRRAEQGDARQGGGLRHHPVGVRGRARAGRHPAHDGGLRPAHARGLQADGGARVPARAQAQDLRQEHGRAGLGRARRHRQPERAGDLLLQVRPRRHLHQGRDRRGADDLHAAAARRPGPGRSGSAPRPGARRRPR